MNNEKRCKNCGGELVKRETQKKASQLTKAYYYSAYYFCPKCKKIYHDDKFKVISATTPGLFNEDLTLPSPIRSGIKVDVGVEIWTDDCVQG